MLIHSQLNYFIMKAILIDVHSQTIKEVEIEKNASVNIGHIYEHLKCDCFTSVGIDENNDIFVDDEGLLKLTPLSKFFLYKGYPQPLAGNGLIVGIDEEGDSVEPTLTIQQVAENVIFMNLREVQVYAEVNNI